MLFEWFYVKFFNPYKIKPYGLCPVQAHGNLPTGEYYYFRGRGSRIRLDITKNEKAWWDGEILFSESENYGEMFDAGSVSHYEVVRFVNKKVKKYYETK